MLLSAGGFAVYLTESNVFGLLAQRFGDLSRAQNRRRLMQVWLGSKLFRASGLDAPLIEGRILAECRNYGDFLRITMEEIARTQGAARWAENTPEHILYAPLIKALIPDVLFVHMIRDGRAVALSLDQRSDRGLQVLPWDRKHNLLIQGIYWEWIVRRGRERGRKLGADYTEVRFEDLVENPGPSLASLGQFLGQELDYDRIRAVGYRSVRKPNTSFRNESGEGVFDPVNRWRKAYTPEQLEGFESLAGNLLRELGYPLLTSGKASARFRRLQTVYRAYYRSRFGLKTSPLGKLRPQLTARDLDEIVMGEDGPPKLLQPAVFKQNS
jgi:hypothetical protein